MSIPPDEEAILDEISAEIDDRLKRGEHPTIEEYAERYPSLAEEIRSDLRLGYQLRHAAWENPSGPNIKDP